MTSISCVIHTSKYHFSILGMILEGVIEALTPTYIATTCNEFSNKYS